MLVLNVLRPRSCEMAEMVQQPVSYWFSLMAEVPQVLYGECRASCLNGEFGMAQGSNDHAEPMRSATHDMHARQAVISSTDPDAKSPPQPERRTFPNRRAGRGGRRKTDPR